MTASSRPVLGWPALIRLAPGATARTAVLATAGEAVTLAVPALSAAALDRITGRVPATGILLALAALVAVRAIVEMLGGIARVTAASQVTAALRTRLVRHVLALGLPVLRRTGPGDLLTRLTGNADTAGTALPALITASVALAASLGGTIALWLIDWRLGLVLILGALAAVLVLRRTMADATGSYAAYQERLAEIVERLVDALAGARTIRAAGIAEQEAARVLEPLPGLTQAGRSTWDVQRAASMRTDLALTVVRVAVLLTAGAGVAAGRLTPGDVLAAALYLGIALSFLNQVDAVIRLADARAGADRVGEILALSPPAALGAEKEATGRTPADGPLALTLRGVRVSIGDRTVLDGVDLDIPAGATVAVVGHSGAGKSTLALTVGGLIRPDAGEVLVGGRPAAARPGPVGHAFDRPVLVGDTIRDAVGYGRTGLTDARIWAALRAAQAAEFVRRLPAGLGTPLDQAPLSGGERQRLGLARALLHRGGVLVLDDATSSLDTATEALVAETIATSSAGRTRLLVAHRAGTAARADLVAWLDQGRIRALAPHDRLWSRDPAYRAIFAAEAGR